MSKQTTSTGSKKGSHLFALPDGTKLLEYEIEELLGHGGFGITYRATDTLLRETVAIKEFLPNELAVRTNDSTVHPKSDSDTEDFQAGLKAFLEEARVITRFRHPNIVHVRRFFELNGTGYIALDYERGLTLSQRLAKGPLSKDELRNILVGLLEGLETIHDRAVLHRDLKPSNIILREDGSPVLIDFGAARDFKERHSRSITAIAAPGYSPPEQYGVGGRQGPWTDIYALGAIAYRCVTGNVPVDSLRRLRKDPLVPAVKAAAGKYDMDLLKAIDWMLQIEEADRPASAVQLRDALWKNPEGQGKARKTKKQSQTSTRTQQVVAGAIVTTVLLIGVGAINFGNLRTFACDKINMLCQSEAGALASHQAVTANAPPTSTAKGPSTASPLAAPKNGAPGAAASTTPSPGGVPQATVVPPPPDETDWEAVKDSNEPEQLRRFTERHPNSSRNVAANARIAQLEEQKAAAEAARAASNAQLAARAPTAPTPSVDDATVITDGNMLREVRRLLYELNFDPGPSDGSRNELTQQAIREFQTASRLASTGQATIGLLQKLRQTDGLRPWGAIVFKKSSEKWGVSWGHETRSEAMASARATCGDTCPIEVSFFGQECAAFAYSDTSWAIVSRDGLQKAKDAALADCGKKSRKCLLIQAVCANGSDRSKAAR